MSEQLINEYLICKTTGQLIRSLRSREFLSLVAATGTSPVLQLNYNILSPQAGTDLLKLFTEG